MKKSLKKKYKKQIIKSKKFLNVFFGVIIFLGLIGLAFSISFLFGAFFVLGFIISIYNDDLKKKSWKPLLIFIGALITRFAIEQYMWKALESTTAWDLIVSGLTFLIIFSLGWKIKKS